MAEETKDLATKEEQGVDTKLVEETCKEIATIFLKHANTAFIEVGEYLIKKFFDDDIEQARGYNKKKFKESSKGKTLKQVIDNFKKGEDVQADNDQSDPKPKGLSQSWLYQAINLVIEEKYLEEELSDKSFQTYGKLLLSHKVALLPVKDIDEKEELIEKAGDKNLSVRALKAEIDNHESGSDRIPGLLSIINTPKNFFKDECQEKLTLEALKKLGNQKLEKIPKRIKDKKKEIETELIKLREDINTNNKYLEKLRALEPTINKAIDETKGTSRKRKQKTED